MGCGFSKNYSTETRVSSFDRQLLDLKVQRDNLQQYEQRLQESLKKYVELARRLVAERERKRALVVLKVKHALQKSIEQAQNMRLNLEQVLSEIEFKQLENDYLQKIRAGTKLLQNIQKKLSIEEIEHLLEETKEAIEFQNQVSLVLGGYSVVETDDECEEELQQLETQVLPKHLEKVEQLPPLKKQVKTTVTNKTEQEGHLLLAS